MLFSIVIPTYNREKIVSRAINSILNQSLSDYEIIIVDDGSIDNTEKIIGNIHSDKISYYKTENKGVAHARNYGMQKAKGDYIGFLDSDDLYEPDHLVTASNFIVSKGNPEVIHLNFLWGDKDKSITHKNILPKTLPNDIFKNCSLHVNCLFIKRIVVEDFCFNENRELMFAEDWDFFIRLSVRYKIYLLDKITAYLIDHEDRSMRDFDEYKWVLKRNAITKSLKEDVFVNEKYSTKINAVTAHMNSLIAINLAVRKCKIKTIKYWISSLSQSINELFTRRSAAIIKHLIFTW